MAGRLLCPAMAMFQDQMTDQHGFTLLEVLFVLSIWSLLIFLSIPFIFSPIDSQTEKQFFQTLESDLLLIQSWSHGTTLNNGSITFNTESYTLRLLGEEDKIVTRDYPHGWRTDERTYKRISFKDGTIRQPGTILLQSAEDDFKIIFPLGKGRGYVEKQ